MRAFAKAAVIFLSLLTVMVTASYTLDSNLKAGVYPSDADNIAIPLIETVSTLVVILVPFAIAFVITSFAIFRKRILLVIGAFLYLCGALLAGLFALSWFIPNHYSIAISYVFVAAVALTLAAWALRRPPSNPELKQDGPSAPTLALS